MSSIQEMAGYGVVTPAAPMSPASAYPTPSNAPVIPLGNTSPDTTYVPAGVSPIVWWSVIFGIIVAIRLLHEKYGVELD